ncbi:MAG: hypothetical protein MZV65_31125 [Chromatiales bacterium]|nr:hypothetical protein [Chromatiales bacterium]
MTLTARLAGGRLDAGLEPASARGGAQAGDHPAHARTLSAAHPRCCFPGRALRPGPPARGPRRPGGPVPRGRRTALGRGQAARAADRRRPAPGPVV